MTGMRSYSPQDLRVPSATPIPLLSGWWMAGVLATCILIEAALLARTGLVIEGAWPLFGFTIWALAAVAICVAFRNPTTQVQRIARDLTEGVSLFGLVSLLGAVATYPLAAGRGAFVDAELERIDLLLRFDWVSWYELVAGHPWVQTIARPVYMSIFATPAFLIGYMAWKGRRAEIRLFVATFAIAEFMTLTLFPFFPAAGPLVTLWRGSLPYMPVSALYQDQVIHALRDHALRAVDLGALHGLVCAPSFHAASAVIYMATALKVRPLRV